MNAVPNSKHTVEENNTHLVSPRRVFRLQKRQRNALKQFDRQFAKHGIADIGRGGGLVHHGVKLRHVGQQRVTRQKLENVSQALEYSGELNGGTKSRMI
jgi:uncharacterized protein YjiS (DUF1127 family)